MKNLIGIVLVVKGSMGFIPPVGPPGRTAVQSSPSDYLSSISSRTLPTTPPPPPPPPHIAPGETTSCSCFHAPLSYFAIDKLTPKGPRKAPDVGAPYDATRKLASVGATSAGSWWCAEGGWPSLNERTTTEIFYVFSGHGCVTDLDNQNHYFGPGDTVILPKGWSGRWDVMQSIHKVWCVVEHPKIEETSFPIRAVVTHYSNLAPEPRGGDDNGRTASRTIYDVGPTQVGCWTCEPGTFAVHNRPTTEFFHVLDGVFFLTNSDDTARRCVAGDTVVLPRGWSGHWDVISPVTKLWVVVDD